MTALVSGNGGYQASISGDGYSYGLTLVVAFSHPDLPAGSVVVNDGLVDVSTGHSGPDSESTKLEALAGSYDLWVHTVGDDGPEVVGYGNQTDEQILFNDTPVGGPLDHNLGLYASLLRMPVTAVDCTNTVTIASQDDWLSWDVTVLATRNPGGNQIHFDLDVNDDKDLDDPADGVSNYLPGYGPDDPASADTTPKLSSGPFDATVYTPQRLNLVIEGVGSSSGYDQVLFVIEDVTNYEGFAENASDPLVEGEGATDDYSFLPYEDSREAYGTMEADRTWVPFWAKDYGGWARVQVFGLIGATSFLLGQKDVPLDADGDGLADKWELEQITQWENQYWVTVTRPDKLTFFSPNLDDEEKDPDGIGNGDGGTNLPAHKTIGDSLTVLQEYRGFTLDGGGHDWDGNNPHGGGHKRLSPVFKELLVETDIMKDVPNMPTLDEIKTILNTTAKGFSNKNDGAGIRMYWVIDEREAAPHKVFANQSEKNEWAVDHKNAKLSEFVHLMYADHRSDSESGGGSGTKGSSVYIKRHWDEAANRDDFLALLPHTTAHELTHLLLNTINANGFDASEHLEDPDPSDPPDKPKDQKYLMFFQTTPENRTTIIFSNPTRMQIDLKSKESVERT